MGTITAESLGCSLFKRDYGLRYAYLAGAMYKGIASERLVAALGKAGMMGFLGTGGLELNEIEQAINATRKALPNEEPFGVNLLANPEHPEIEDRTVDLLLKYAVRTVEASAFVRITPALVRWRLCGLMPEDANLRPSQTRRILAKVSRPEVAAAFMQPAPEAIVSALLAQRRITPTEAELAKTVPVADDICVEADSGGHTDQGVASVLIPTMLLLRDEMMAKHRYRHRIRVGAAGGIGTPQAVAATFISGADFIVTGSINQCTVEAGTSDVVKDLLQELNIQDTSYAPAGDMFEIGARVQVARRGLFFAARANKLFELYQRYNSIDEIDSKTLLQIEERYFRRSIAEVWNETREYYMERDPHKLKALEQNPKQKMASIFKWYFAHTTKLALQGDAERKVDFQIHCGPALGAFNQWVKGTDLHSWRNRHVAQIGERLMHEGAALLQYRLRSMMVDDVDGS